jgi:hypothetical protein
LLATGLEVLCTCGGGDPRRPLTNRVPRYFAAYEVTKKWLTPAGSSPSELNLGAIILAGGTAGMAMWSLAIPPDVRFLVACDIDRQVLTWVIRRSSSREFNRLRQAHTPDSWTVHAKR